jgi:hypothetical protein
MQTSLNYSLFFDLMKIGIVCYPHRWWFRSDCYRAGQRPGGKGHQVHFITYSEPARLENFHSNIFYHEVSFQNYALFQYAPYETALASRMVDTIKFEKLDILHVHYAIPHVGQLSSLSKY